MKHNVSLPWTFFAVFALACLGVALLLRGCSDPVSSPRLSAANPMPELIERLQERHPDWKPYNGRDDDSTFVLRCYILAKPYPVLKNWRVPSLPASDPVEKINQYPFEADAWERIVFVRIYQNEDSEKQGWYGHVLLKGPFLFYGDKKMLKQIDETVRDVVPRSSSNWEVLEEAAVKQEAPLTKEEQEKEQETRRPVP